jgi:3-oxoacyl-[acyl-carrier protein] reductase
MQSFDIGVFDAMAGVNIRGVFYACRAVWPSMMARGGGAIVNISSMAAVDPFPGFAAYGASKCFVEGLTRGLAAEGQRHGIGVWGVGPGAVETEMLRGPFPDFPAERCLQPEEVAETVWLVTQPAWRHTSGQTIYVRKS